MEQIYKAAERASGAEVLYFENAEVEKVRGDEKLFAAAGPMSVLYFKDYNRFVLQIGDWRYPLLRRLSASSSNQTDASRTFTFGGLNGAEFNVKINDSNTYALSNFETVLKNSSNFGTAGENRKIELSPDDKVTRTLKKETFAATAKVTGMVKSAYDKVKHLAKISETGTKNLNSRKQMMKLSDIKNKNFKKTAKPTFKKDYFTAGQKLATGFADIRTKNINNTQAREWTDMSKFANLPAFYIAKNEIEGAILNNKDIAAAFGAGESKKTGLLGNLKSGISGAIQNTRAGLNNLASDIASRVHPTQPTVQPADKSEGLTHYQG